MTHAQTQTEKIVYGMPYDFSEYSAFTADSYATRQWVSAVYGFLIKRSSTNNDGWIGDLAQQLPSISSDGLTFTFTLRDNLFFSDGKPLTSDDVEFSLNVAITPEINKASSLWASISDSNYVDYLGNSSFVRISDSQFSITLFNPYPFPYSLLAFPIIPKHIFDTRYQNCINGVTADCEWNAPDGSDAISAGPFMVKEIDTTNQIVTVTANPYYWQAANIKTNEIVFKKIADKVSAISALADGSIDILDSQYVPGVNELQGISGISESFVGDPATQEMSINHKHPYFGTGDLIPNSIGETSQTQIYENARLLRHAMSLIMDRQTMVKEIMQGLAQPIATQMPPDSIGFDPSVEPDPYNLTGAINIMKNLGFNYTLLGTPDENGVYPKSFFNITILAPNTGPARNQWPSYYVEELPKIGIGIEKFVATGWDVIIPRTFGSSVNPPLYNDGGYDVFFVGYAWGLDWNPDGIYEAKGSCSTGDCSNFYNFDLNETMTPIAKVVREYLTTLDYNLRMQYVSELQHLLYYWNPVIPILSPKSHWAWSNQITGLDGKLLGLSNQEWELVSKTGFQLNTDLKTGSTGSTTTERVKVVFSPFFLFGLPVLIIIRKISKKEYTC